MDSTRAERDRKARRVTAAVAIWTVVALLLVTTWEAATTLASRDRREAVIRAERDTANLSRTIAEQAGRAVSDADRILRFVAFDISRLGTGDTRIVEILRDAAPQQNLLFQLSYTDARGDLIQTSVEGDNSHVNLADREHFLVHKTSRDVGLFISKPVFGRASNRWSIQLSRRIETPSGEFAGIVVASLDPFYFSHTFDALDVGRNGVVAVVGTDAILRARSGMDNGTIGQNLAGSSLYRAALAQPSGFMRTVSVIDHLPRLVSFRTIPGYPLYVYAGFEEAAFMAETVERKHAYVIASGVMSLLLLSLGALAQWQTSTQERARRNAERSNRLKSEFLATISHELRTPMNGVLGTLTLLEGGGLTPEHTRHVSLARRSATALLTLLDDLLNFSKLEAGKVVIEPIPGELRAVADEVMEMLQPVAAEKGIEMRLELASTVPRRVVSDFGRLRQILFNLLGNAVKFTEQGHVRTRIDRGAALPDGRFVLDIFVEDTGIGIPAEALPTLFDQFTQADSSVTRRYGGTGLGLAICRQLCTAMGGGIDVVSVPGKGSVFHAWIACAEDLAASPPAEAPAMAPSLPDDLHILVVDDHAINREVLCGILGRAGHHCETASDGARAVEMLRDGPFDLVLMDIQMPGLDGLSAAGRVRHLPEPACHVPIIAVTAHAGPSSRQECLDAGMDSMLSKPVRPETLFTEAARVLHLRGARPLASARRAPDLPPHDDTSAALIDDAQTDDLRLALGPETWRQMLASFDDAARSQIEALAARIAAGEDHAALAHALKGIALNMGASALGDRARRIEKAPPAEAARLCATLGRCLEASLAALARDEVRHAA